MRCPLCSKEAKTSQGLTKHLMGGVRYGGHELNKADALQQVVRAAHVSGPPAGAPPVKLPNIAHDSSVPDRVKSGFLYSALARVVDNKDLPKYQFERVIDAFLGSFLPDIVAAVDGGSIELVAQEFPLKKPDSFQSTNMDYVLFRHDDPKREGAWIFLELKTDPRSLRVVQDAIYTRILDRDTTMTSLIEDVRAISGRSSQPAKYHELLGRFEGYRLDRPLEVMYLAPARHELPGYDGVFRSITFADLRQIELEDFAGEWGVFKELVLPTFPAS